MSIVLYPYYGGKNRPNMREFILSKFPQDYRDLHYVETNFGSGGIFFGKESSALETINDIDGNVVNFIRVLREDRQALIDALSLTPWAKEEFELSKLKLSAGSDEKLSPLERARLFYVLVRQGFNSATKGGSQTWKFSVSPGVDSPKCPRQWKNAVKQLGFAADRLMDAQIDHMDALDLIAKYDSADTIFYIDPPYIHETRSKTSLDSYANETCNIWHLRLVELLLNLKGKAVLSGYAHDIYAPLEAAGWKRFDQDFFASSNRSRVKRTESLWLNFEQSKQMTIFDFASSSI